MNKACTLPLIAILFSSCSFSLSPKSETEGPSSSSSETSSETPIESSESEEITTSESGPVEISKSSEEEESSVTTSSSEAIEDEDFLPSEDYKLTWSDEFDGEALNTRIWTHEIGNGNWGWGNGEAEYYTAKNDRVEDGMLHITAKREEAPDGFQYTSTRIITKNKVHFTYGYMCARISLPAVTGLWPAFWMLPETGYGSEGTTWWPTSGEIDIMENRGRVSDTTSGALHYASNGTGGNHTYISAETKVGSIEDFHVYAVEWLEGEMIWSVDGEEFLRTGQNIWNRGYGTGDDAPFNKDFFFILNLAIGGQFDGNKEPPVNWESSDMIIDYVRCYQK